MPGLNPPPLYMTHDQLDRRIRAIVREEMFKNSPEDSPEPSGPAATPSPTSRSVLEGHADALVDTLAIMLRPADTSDPFHYSDKGIERIRGLKGKPIREMAKGLENELRVNSYRFTMPVRPAMDATYALLVALSYRERGVDLSNYFTPPGSWGPL